MTNTTDRLFFTCTSTSPSLLRPALVLIPHTHAQARSSATEACARKDRLGLLQRFDLTVARHLPDLEVVQREITSLMKRPVHAPEVKEVGNRAALIGLIVGLLDLVLGLGLFVSNDARLFRFDLGIRVFDEGFVGSLRILFRRDRVLLHLGRVRDDILDERHGASAPRLLVLPETGRHGLHSRTRHWLLLVLHQGRLLVVELAKAINRLLQDILRCTLVRHCLLEVLVLLLSVLARLLHLDLRVRDLLCQAFLLCVEVFLIGIEVIDLLLDVGLVLVPLGRLLVVLVQIRDAIVLVVDLVVLLLPEGADHVVDAVAKLAEGVEAHPRREVGYAGAVEFLARFREELNSLGPLRGVALRLRVQLQEAEALAEKVPSVVIREESDGFRDSRDLLPTHLRPRLPVLVHLCALLLQRRKKSGVSLKCLAGVLQTLLGLSILIQGIGSLCLLIEGLLCRSLDLHFFRTLQLRVRFCAFSLVFAGALQIGLERLLHLLQNSKDFTRGRSVSRRPIGLL